MRGDKDKFIELYESTIGNVTFIEHSKVSIKEKKYDSHKIKKIKVLNLLLMSIISLV